MKVRVPSPLRSYTGGLPEVEGEGSDLAQVLAGLDARYPGFRFRIVDEQDRIRPHIRFFVGGEMAHSIQHPVAGSDEIQIVAALSGG